MKTLLPLLFAFVFVFVGCKKEQPAQQPQRQGPVDVIAIGKSVTADKQIDIDDRVFKPKDTVYVSVSTQNGAGNIKATFKYGDKVIKEDSVMAKTSSPFVEFHISQPSGLPEGNYSVVINRFGETKSPETFEVRK